MIWLLIAYISLAFLLIPATRPHWIGYWEAVYESHLMLAELVGAICIIAGLILAFVWLVG